MSKIMNDHQDSKLFTYSRSWVEIEAMLDKAERVQNVWLIKLEESKEYSHKNKASKAARNIKALEGVIKTLRWTLGDMDVPHPLN